MVGVMTDTCVMTVPDNGPIGSGQRFVLRVRPSPLGRGFGFGTLSKEESPSPLDR